MSHIENGRRLKQGLVLLEKLRNVGAFLSLNFCFWRLGMGHGIYLVGSILLVHGSLDKDDFTLNLPFSLFRRLAWPSPLLDTFIQPFPLFSKYRNLSLVRSRRLPCHKSYFFLLSCFVSFVSILYIVYVSIFFYIIYFLLTAVLQYFNPRCWRRHFDRHLKKTWSHIHKMSLKGVLQSPLQKKKKDFLCKVAAWDLDFIKLKFKYSIIYTLASPSIFFFVYLMTSLTVSLLSV